MNLPSVAHLADIHIPNDINRHQEYRIQFEKTYQQLSKLQPDIIVIVGDLFENFIDIINEADDLADDFLTKLAALATEVVIVPGNHDIRKKHKQRLNSVKNIVKLIKIPNITYFEKSGFYEDQYFPQIVWVNHSHLEKEINPWSCDDAKLRDKEKVYIDLFHDPINGCYTDSGFKMEKKSYHKLSDFQGDFGFFGDIHKFQFLNKEKTYAYPSSLIQQNFGEDPQQHGFLFWDLTTKKATFQKVASDYTMVNIHLGPDTDYEALEIKNNNIKEHTKFKVHWQDYGAKMTIENELKIKRYLKESFGEETVKFDKDTLQEDMSNIVALNEKLDLNDIEIQENIFREYLTHLKYEEVEIEKILEIDRLITSRIDAKNFEKNIEWSIKKIWFDNFRCLGQRQEIDWEDKKGIIQITGENRQGKSTLLDLLTYIHYGTILATSSLGGGKKEKFGDNRFINNKRELDYCLGGSEIEVDGEIIRIERRTDREWSRNKTSIKKVYTTLNIYDSQGHLMVGENKNQTQQKLDKILGTFEDFVRLAFTNADNLNSMLAMGRANFIDNIIRDAGYEIFEVKSEVFKEYKKELKEESLHLDLLKEEEQVKIWETEKESLLSNITKKEQEIQNLKLKIVGLHQTKEKTLAQKHQIDPDLKQLNITELEKRLESYQEKIQTNLKQQKANQQKMKNLTVTYDEEGLEKRYKENQQLSQQILDEKLLIKDLETKIITEKNQLEKIDIRCQELKDNEISKIETEIQTEADQVSLLKKEFENLIQQEIQQFNNLIKDEENLIKVKTTEIKGLDKEKFSLEKEITELKSSKTCPTCGRDYEDIEHLQKHIQEKDEQVAQLLKEKNQIEEEQTAIQMVIEDYEQQILKLKNEEFEKPELIQSQRELYRKSEALLDFDFNCQEIISQLKKDNYEARPKLQEKIYKGLQMKEKVINNIKNHQDLILTHKNQIKTYEDRQKEIEEAVQKLEAQKNEVKTYQTLVKENQDLDLTVEKLKINIEKFNLKLERYNHQLKFFEENTKIDQQVVNLNKELTQFNEEIEELTNVKKEDEITLSLRTQEIEKTKKLITLYLEQQKKERILKEYSNCIHRDGIPTFLLKKSMNVINRKLDDLLAEVDFRVYFNEDLQLKMWDNGAEINALESCGAERTFIATVLKNAFRMINNKSKPDFILYDEIFGKMKSESVAILINILNEMKKDINRIIIIEHKEPIDFDHLIRAVKNEQGVSQFELT
jgi:DNA repair exonuclease SbcCD ATPase subunit